MFNFLEAQPKSGSPISPEPDSSMQEYYALQQNLLLTTLAMTGAIFVAVCFFYPLNIALNYLIGALVSMVYLRMLGRDVERLGRKDKKLSRYRLALIAGVIIVATQLHQLKILPIFLGFLTYKAALIIYVLRTTFTPESK
jgi:ATP synthase protein I